MQLREHGFCWHGSDRWIACRRLYRSGESKGLPKPTSIERVLSTREVPRMQRVLIRILIEFTMSGFRDTFRGQWC